MAIGSDDKEGRNKGTTTARKCFYSLVKGRGKVEDDRYLSLFSMCDFMVHLFYILAGEEEGDDATSERIRQQCIGEYSGVTRTLYLERCGPVFWSGDRPPRDRTITRIVPNRVNITIYSALCIVASLGIVLAFSFLIVNIKYRRQK